MVNKRRGRPTGNSGARERIMDAALVQFSSIGYRSASVRGIAREADIDHALVHYYYESKEGLFRAAMDLAITPGQRLDEVFRHAAGAGSRASAPPTRPSAGDPRPGRPGMGSAILRSALVLWEHPASRDDLAGFLENAIVDPAARTLLRDYLESAVIARIAEEIGGRDASERAGAAGAIMAGVFLTRYVLRLEPLASLPLSTAVRLVGPSVDAALRPRTTDRG